jgi:cyclic beta-1,2-glucan synthetase
VLSGDAGNVEDHLNRPYDEPEWPPPLAVERPSPERREADSGPDIEVPDLVHWNGRGGFTPGGHEYVVVLNGADQTPLPWANVLANPRFGSVVTSAGPSYTWSENSRENRLTPFANDPVTEASGEAIFLRDDETGEDAGSCVTAPA